MGTATIRPLGRLCRAGRVIVTCIGLAACAGATGWVKDGADEAGSSGAYRECRAAAADAVRTDRQVDSDIMATRGRDWANAHTLPQTRAAMDDLTQTRSEAIVDRCMQSKGYRKLG